MQAGGYLTGNSAILKKYKIGAASITAAGIVGQAGSGAGIIACTTTSFANSPGLILDTATYSTTQGDPEGIVTVDAHPFLIVRAKMCGGATADTALPTLTNTSASAGGTTVADSTNVGTATMATGTLWCTSGNNVGLSRVITTFNSATSEVVVVPFPRAIAVGDTFCQCPWAVEPGTGSGNVQATTTFIQANAIIVAGTGGDAAVWNLVLNGTTDSYVEFRIADHVQSDNTL